MLVGYFLTVILLAIVSCRLFPGGVTRAKLEYHINDFAENYPHRLAFIFNQRRPGKPDPFKDIKRSLGLKFNSDHHVISALDINKLFKDILPELEDIDYRHAFANKLATFALDNELVRYELENYARDAFDCFQIIRAYLIWNPGNLIPGPQPKNRQTEFGSGFDKEVFREYARQDPENARKLQYAHWIITDSFDPYEKLAFIDTWGEIFERYHYDVEWEQLPNNKYKIPVAEELLFLE
jgi:hypothetical protein